MSFSDLDSESESTRADAAADLTPEPRSILEKQLLLSCAVDESERAREAMFDALLRGRGLRPDLFSLVDVCGHCLVRSPLRTVRFLGREVFANVLYGLDSGRTALELGAISDFAGISRMVGAEDSDARRFLRSMADRDQRRGKNDQYLLDLFAGFTGIPRVWGELGILERLTRDARAVRALGTLGSSRSIPILRELVAREIGAHEQARAALEALGSSPDGWERRLERIEIDKIVLDDTTSFDDLIQRAFSDRRGGHPITRTGLDGILSLYGRLVEGGPCRRWKLEGHASRFSRAIAALMMGNDERLRDEAFVFFGKHPLAAGAERIYEFMDAGDHDREIGLASNVLWILRGRATGGRGGAIARARAELRRKDLPEELREVLSVYPIVTS